MDDLSAARGQMELSLGFHMVLAASGIGVPDARGRGDAAAYR
jgi:hypothetical protein